MKQFLLTMAGVFAGLVLFFIGVPFILIGMAAGATKPTPTPGSAVLTMDLRKGLTDQEAAGAFGFLGSSKYAVMSVVSALHAAETDNRVKALFVRLPEVGIEPGEADELRVAFRHFEAAGKPIIVHSQGLAPEGVVTSTYMLGAAGTQLWMQPGAPFQAVGLASQDIFYKRFFDKYGIKADYEQRAEFKNAVNPYLYDDYTPAHRQAQLSWMGSVYQTALVVAAHDRGQDPTRLQAVLEAGPYDAADAKAKRLIDQVGQVKEAEAAALAKGGEGARFEPMEDYIATQKLADGSGSGPTIAVINAEGDIATGPADEFGSNGINSDATSKALYDAADDDSVKAVVFRVNSPGGSDTASEQILAAVRAVKAKKPIVVSMGTYGASGGYWISSQASAIVAEPTTLTGSIGVYGGKFAVGEALGRFGVDMRNISVGGQYATADDPGQDFTPQQKAAFAASIDKVYAGFISRVAEGRHLPPAKVADMAKGHIWTGLQAKDLGLVDQLGGFYTAVDKAKALAGIKGEARLKTVNAHKSPFEAFAHAFGASSKSTQVMSQVAWLLGDPKAQAVLRNLTEAKLRSSGADVLMSRPGF
jgi:protease-4